ncbi:MAG: hypothetical protein C4617_02115 [Candidatus Liberibacter europaeus]|uniref:Flagellar hook-length control protein-like C-terminal domain-containing protein n=1 Tax=Candidatus Liberibacter europaeus TaxID=744859 RepID=A0A2T4VXX9_9HYPH|nr:hypothetical protein [Candidatus Liberibacter europaeus]PTL86633.1 MAG: hypothetical protein C4617_02115 [Candidatus Liberibacter europaeus]
MKDVIISSQEHLDVRTGFLNQVEDKLNSVNYKKKDNAACILKKSDDKSNLNSQMPSSFEKIISTTFRSNKSIHDNQFEENLCQGELSTIIMMPGVLFPLVEQNDLLLENSSEFITSYEKDVFDFSNIIPNDLSVIKEKSDHSLEDVIALLQLKSFADFTNHDSEALELPSSDIPAKIDFSIENKLISDIVSKNDTMQDFRCISIPGNFCLDNSIDFHGFTVINTNQKIALRFAIIPEHVRYMERGMINTLKIQIKPDSYDNITATLCLSGNRLSIKIQVESSHLYKRIQNERLGILDSLNFAGYIMDSFDVNFVQNDKTIFHQDLVNSYTQQQNFTQSGDFKRRKSSLPERNCVDKEVPVSHKEKRRNIYNGEEVIGSYYFCIYV